MTDTETILYAITNIINITVRHQVILNRWTKVVSCMLEKIRNRPLITKLRVIHLFEADYNFLLGLKWSKEMCQQQEETDNFGN